MNWNPGLSLFVKEGVPLEDAAPLLLPPHHPSATSSGAQEQAAGAGLTGGEVAGIAVGAAAAALALAAAALWWQRRRRRASGSMQQLLPTAHALAPAGQTLKAKASLPNELPEVQVAGGEVELVSGLSQPMSTPRRRTHGSPGHASTLPEPPALPSQPPALPPQPPAATGSGVLAAISLQAAPTVPPSPFAELAAKAPFSGRPSTESTSVSGRLTTAAVLAAGSSALPLLPASGSHRAAAAGGSGGRSGSGGGGAPASAADGSAQGSQLSLGLDEWSDVLVRREGPRALGRLLLSHSLPR